MKSDLLFAGDPPPPSGTSKPKKRRRTGRASLYVIIEAKEPTDGSRQTLLTREHFREMVEFDEFVMNITVDAPPGYVGEETSFTFYDLCRKRDILSDKAKELAAQACIEYGEAYCVVDSAERCRTTP